MHTYIHIHYIHRYDTTHTHTQICDIGLWLFIRQTVSKQYRIIIPERMYLLVWLEVEPDITRRLQIWIYFEKRINKQTVVCSLDISILVRTMKRTTQQPHECIKGKNSVVKMLPVIVFMSSQSTDIFRSQFQYHQFYQMIWFTCRWEHYVQIVLLGKQQRVCLKVSFMDA